MLDAVLTDFSAIPNVIVETVTFTDTEDEDRILIATAAHCDWAVVIAPEFDGVLLRLCEQIRATGCRLLGPAPSAITLTADKLALAQHWHEHGVPTPPTVSLDARYSISYPAVLKPRDGVGSEHVHLCSSPDVVDALTAQLHATGWQRPMILQPFVPGQAASVAFLIGPEQVLPLSPCYQHLSTDGCFTYQGGALPMPPPLAERSVTLGQRAIANISGLRGYVGVDIVLGPNPNGAQDFAIEINPRFTTSYVGLRAHADFNIAALLFRLARGELGCFPRWHPHSVYFQPDGNLETTMTHKQLDRNK